MTDIVQQYLDLLDSQREAAYAALVGLTKEQIWQRPTTKEWCLGEILDHNFLLIGSTFPYIKTAWKVLQRRAEKRCTLPYVTLIDDPYRKSSFPMWVGFLWKPRYTPKKPISLERLEAETRDLHAAVRNFYSAIDPALLGHVFIYDPLFGLINLIVTLRIGIYHDQLHFDDVFKNDCGAEIKMNAQEFLIHLDKIPHLLEMASQQDELHRYRVQNDLRLAHRQEGHVFLYSMPMRHLFTCPTCGTQETDILHEVEDPRRGEKIGFSQLVLHQAQFHDASPDDSLAAFVEACLAE